MLLESLNSWRNVEVVMTKKFVKLEVRIQEKIAFPFVVLSLA